MSDKCEFCGDVGWIVTGATHTSPYGEQEQCPLCGCRDYITTLKETLNRLTAEVEDQSVIIKLYRETLSKEIESNLQPREALSAIGTANISTDVEANIKGYVIELEQSNKRLRAELAMATDAANKGDKARGVAQALTDENERLRAEIKSWEENYILRGEVQAQMEGAAKLAIKIAATRCVEIAKEVGCGEAFYAADNIIEEYGL